MSSLVFVFIGFILGALRERIAIKYGVNLCLARQPEPPGFLFFLYLVLWGILLPIELLAVVIHFLFKLSKNKRIK